MSASGLIVLDCAIHSGLSLRMICCNCSRVKSFRPQSIHTTRELHPCSSLSSSHPALVKRLSTFCVTCQKIYEEKESFRWDVSCRRWLMKMDQTHFTRRFPVGKGSMCCIRLESRESGPSNIVSRPIHSISLRTGQKLLIHPIKLDAYPSSTTNDLHRSIGRASIESDTFGSIIRYTRLGRDTCTRQNKQSFWTREKFFQLFHIGFEGFAMWRYVGFRGGWDVLR